MEDETDIRLLWQGLHAITSFDTKPSGSSNSRVASLPDKVNVFYERFDRDNTDMPFQTPIAPDGILISVTKAHVRRSFRWVNVDKGVN